MSDFLWPLTLSLLNRAMKRDIYLHATKKTAFDTFPFVSSWIRFRYRFLFFFASTSSNEWMVRFRSLVSVLSRKHLFMVFSHNKIEWVDECDTKTNELTENGSEKRRSLSNEPYFFINHSQWNLSNQSRETRNENLISIYSLFLDLQYGCNRLKGDRLQFQSFLFSLVFRYVFDISPKCSVSSHQLTMSHLNCENHIKKWEKRRWNLLVMKIGDAGKLFPSQVCF